MLELIDEVFTIRIADNKMVSKAAPMVLSAHIIARLEAATSRLRGEFQRCLADVPVSDRSVHGLAGRWGVDRNLTQRLLAGLNPARDDLNAFATFPGVRGLAAIVAAVEGESRGKTRRRASPLRTALESYAEAVRAAGGSQSAIVRELARSMALQTMPTESGTADQGGGSSAFERRQAAIAGCTLDLDYGISGITLSRQYPGRWQNFVVSAYVGVRCEREGVTLTFQRTVTGQSAGELLPDVTSRSLAEMMDGQEGTLARYGRGPAPRFSRREAGGEERDCIDLPASEEPLDIVVGAVRDCIDTTPTREGVCWAQGVRVRYPTKQLIFDHYVHRSLEKGWFATGGCYWWTPTLISHPQIDWHERIGVPVRVERDESGLAPPPLREWSRAVNLNAEVLEALDWRRSDFVRYRVWVDQPIWGSMVYLTFLSAGPAHDSPHAT